MILYRIYTIIYLMFTAHANRVFQNSVTLIPVSNFMSNSTSELNGANNSKNSFSAWDSICNFLHRKYATLKDQGFHESSRQEAVVSTLIAQTGTLLSIPAKISPCHSSIMSAQISGSLSLAQQYSSLSDEWEYVGEDSAIKVWKCKISLSKCMEAAQWPCVKSRTIIDAPADALMRLLMDSSKIHITNKYSLGRVDIENIDASTKVVWNRSKIPIFSLSYDLSLLMHCHKAVNDDSYMIVTRSIDHPDVPLQQGFSRAETFLGVTILVPLRSDTTKTEIISINHSRIPGIHPFLASRNFFHSTVNYFKQLQAIAADIREL